jgi:hypothetical protein
MRGKEGGGKGGREGGRKGGREGGREGGSTSRMFTVTLKKFKTQYMTAAVNIKPG